MITRFYERQGRDPASVAADATYGNGEMLQWLRSVGSHRLSRVKAISQPEQVTSTVPRSLPILPEQDSYICPEGKPLKYVRISTS